MTYAKEVLAQVKRCREMDDAVDVLRKRTQRNVPLAVFYGIIALFYLWQAWRSGITQTIQGKSVFLADGVVSLGLAGIWTTIAIQRVWIRSNDRLLLHIAEELLARNESPKHSSEPQRSSLTSP